MQRTILTKFKVVTVLLFSFQLSTRLVNWLFCGPCITFLKTSTTFHKMTLTGVTLLVTSLLVASPILFLISAAPSMPQRDGCTAHEDCIANLPPPECQETICKNVAKSIQSKVNWKVDVCKDFKSFSCSNEQSSLRVMKSPQEITDHQILRKFNFQHFSHFPRHYIQFVFIKLELEIMRPLHYWRRNAKSTAGARVFFLPAHKAYCSTWHGNINFILSRFPLFGSLLSYVSPFFFVFRSLNEAFLRCNKIFT